MIFADLGRYQDAIDCFGRAHELQDQLLGPGHPEALITRNNLAAMDNIVFDWSAAERLYVEGVALARAERGESERVTQFLINNLGYLYLRQGRLDEAERQLTEAYDLRRQYMGSRPPRHLRLGPQPGASGPAARRPRTGEALLRPNLAVRRDLLGDDPRHTVAATVNLGRVRLAEGRLARPTR